MILIKPIFQDTRSGRDYHKLMRKRLKHLGDWFSEQIAPHGFRVFSDSAPILEKHLAEKAGLGWIGKHTLLLSRSTGSWFFLGELLTDYPLPISGESEDSRCGSCSACIDICPTDAFKAPYELDATKCISYLTIEHRGPIPKNSVNLWVIEFLDVMIVSWFVLGIDMRPQAIPTLDLEMSLIKGN